MCGPKEEIPGGVLSGSPLPVEVLGQREQTCLCLPRAQRQTKAKEVDFNSESHCQHSFTGGCYVPGGFTCTYCSHLQPSQQAAVQMETES